MQALSQTPFAHRLLAGPVIHGVSLGRGHLLFGNRVLSLTRPGALRMPNGLECDLRLPEPHAPVRVGRGRLECDAGPVLPGPLWNPRPTPRFAVSTRPGLETWDLHNLTGRGPGLTPLGDDILAGYLAACPLFGVDRSMYSGLAASLASRTTSLSGTLLRLAAEGCVPEAAHRLLEDGDPEPLLAWGATSGSGLLTGLGLYVASVDSEVVRSLDVTLPLDPLRSVYVEIRRVLPGVGALAGESDTTRI